MRFLHTADLHLGPRLDYIQDPAHRARRREDFSRQADRLPDLVREHGAQVLLLAGDVFDRDLPAQPDAARLAAALAEVSIPVLVVPGTHDAWRPGGVWDRTWPSHVRVFRTGRWEVDVIGETAFHALGSTGRPLPGAIFAGLGEAAAARHQVGLVHASMLRADIKERVDRKNHPFEEAELDGTFFDYLALGDHHRQRVVTRGRRVAAYPGSPEGLSFDPAEAGPRGMLLVDLQEPGEAPLVTTVGPTNAREITLDSLDLSELQQESAGDLAEAVRRRLKSLARADRLLRFDLTGVLQHLLPLDVEQVAANLQEDFFALQVRDRTRTLPEGAGDESTVRGAFERRLRARLESAAGEPERLLAERALQVGLQALEGLL